MLVLVDAVDAGIELDSCQRQTFFSFGEKSSRILCRLSDSGSNCHQGCLPTLAQLRAHSDLRLSVVLVCC